MRDSTQTLIRHWCKLLTEEGLSMELGTYRKLSYVGTSQDLEVLEKIYFNRSTWLGGNGLGDDVRRVEPKGAGPDC